ncbi:MAG: acetylxylan esterase [Verrucomicrobia bacterium]|nr:acetylxylan esterase [Verrucomicrobiota bacterium]
MMTTIRTTIIGIFLLQATLWAESTVRVSKQEDGSYRVVTPAYSVAIGTNGFLQSIRAGDTEFLQPHPWFGMTSFVTEFIAGGCVGVLHTQQTAHVLANLQQPSPTQIEARSSACLVRYDFRERDFDIASKLLDPNTGHYYILFPSAQVAKALNERNDSAVRLDSCQQNIWSFQEGMRWIARNGAMLKVQQPAMNGYAQFGWWGYSHPPSNAVYGVSFSVTPRETRYTFVPVANPSVAESVHFEIKCPDADMLLPKDGRLTVTAENLVPRAIEVKTVYEIRDYVRRDLVAAKKTALKLKPHASGLVDTAISIPAPGPYRGILKTLDANGQPVRQIEWIFTYDFPNYHPPLVRPPDFKEFWAETLKKLAATPLDTKMTLNEKESTPESETYEVSLANFNGRRVTAWYCKPRKAGKYPVVYYCPPTGVYPMVFWAGKGNGRYGTFHIAVHGFNVALKDMPEQDPWRGYHTVGLESPKTTSWRFIYAGLVRGMDFLLSRPEVDPDRIMVAGSSQGGGLATVLAGLHPKVAFLNPQFSGLCHLDWIGDGKPGCWPFGMANKPSGQTEEQFLKTLSYFDVANFTPDVRCPTVALIGMMDFVTGSGNQIATFAHLKPGQVEFVCDPWGGHGGCDRQYSQRYKEARQRFLDGQSVILKPAK